MNNDGMLPCLFKLIEHNNNDQMNYKGHDDTRKHLTVGKIYAGLKEVHDWYTHVHIGDHKFNSVCFEEIEPQPEAVKGICAHCGGLIAIRNPTGKCDHLYYPENLPQPSIPDANFLSLNTSFQLLNHKGEPTNITMTAGAIMEIYSPSSQVLLDWEITKIFQILRVVYNVPEKLLDRFEYLIKQKV